MLNINFHAHEPSSSGENPDRLAMLDPRAIILTNLVKVYSTMLHTKNQNPRPSGFKGTVEDARLSMGDGNWLMPIKADPEPMAQVS